MKPTFEIKNTTNGKFMFNLKAANDEVILTSQTYGMYGPPPDCKGKLDGWSARMYTALVGVEHSGPEWNALRSRPI